MREHTLCSFLAKAELVSEWMNDSELQNDTHQCSNTASDSLHTYIRAHKHMHIYVLHWKGLCVSVCGAALTKRVCAGLRAAGGIHGGQLVVHQEDEPAVAALGQLQGRELIPDVEAVP